MIEITPKQASALWARTPAAITTIRIEKSSPTANAVDVNYFTGARHVQTLRIQPGGIVKVIS